MPALLVPTALLMCALDLFADVAPEESVQEVFVALCGFFLFLFFLSVPLYRGIFNQHWAPLSQEKKHFNCQFLQTQSRLRSSSPLYPNPRPSDGCIDICIMRFSNGATNSLPPSSSERKKSRDTKA